MKFYEARFLCPPGTDGQQLDEDSKRVASFIDGPVEVHNTTIHARPTQESSSRHDCAFFVALEDVRELYEFAGKMARLHNMPMVNHQKLGEGEDTLNYKAIEGSDELEEDAIRDAIGADEDEFTITDIHDRADE